MANINVGAVLLTGIVIFGGAMIGGIGRLINGGSFLEVVGGLPWFKSGSKRQKSKYFVHLLSKKCSISMILLRICYYAILESMVVKVIN